MKLILSFLSFLMFFYSYSQSIEDAQMLYDKQEYNEALKVLKKCKNTDDVQLLKAKSNYYLGYEQFACESLKNIGSEDANKLFDTLCDLERNSLNLPKDENGNFYFEEIINLKDSISAKDLFVLIKEWFAYSFVSSQAVIQFIDEDRLKIIGKGGIKYDAEPYKPGTLYTGHFRFTITFECRDNRFKYKIEQIEHQAFKDEYSIGYNFSNEPIMKLLTHSYITNFSKKIVIQDFQEHFDEFILKIRNIKENEVKDDW